MLIASGARWTEHSSSEVGDIEAWAASTSHQARSVMLTLNMMFGGSRSEAEVELTKLFSKGWRVLMAKEVRRWDTLGSATGAALTNAGLAAKVLGLLSSMYALYLMGLLYLAGFEYSEFISASFLAQKFILIWLVVVGTRTVVLHLLGPWLSSDWGAIKLGAILKGGLTPEAVDARELMKFISPWLIGLSSAFYFEAGTFGILVFVFLWILPLAVVSMFILRYAFLRERVGFGSIVIYVAFCAYLIGAAKSVNAKWGASEVEIMSKCTELLPKTFYAKILLRDIDFMIVYHDESRRFVYFPNECVAGIVNLKQRYDLPFWAW